MPSPHHQCNNTKVISTSAASHHRPKQKNKLNAEPFSLAGDVKLLIYELCYLFSNQIILLKKDSNFQLLGHTTLKYSHSPFSTSNISEYLGIKKAYKKSLYKRR